MQTAYIANPVRVMAARIVEVDGALLTMEGGGMFRADAGMTARYTPVPGDYLVTQEDGYVYVNPKDVFERKYRPDTGEDAAPAKQESEPRIAEVLGVGYALATDGRLYRLNGGTMSLVRVTNEAA
ncbi:hypothetical protein 3Fb_00034 [Ralstonia phage Eline]|uniref:Uncharacterized protein n=1 Tax=Ralstonia phage Eline TaxID=2759724 RepID=A0A7G5B9R4_9CAUD|nr:hypothetical protein KMC45_gp34 [Ralstonia phage Eline]QMV33037.1 hypothetical protein 3Fb_00034 [Ralstonia phage Eline]